MYHLSMLLYGLLIYEKLTQFSPMRARVLINKYSPDTFLSQASINIAINSLISIGFIIRADTHLPDDIPIFLVHSFDAFEVS